MFTRILDWWQGKAPLGAARSSQWPKVRREHLKLHPACEVCGSTKKCEVHHVVPFHIDPSKELDPGNLVTLCESGANGATCHLLFGHLGNYRSYNKDARIDVALWYFKIKNRPLAKLSTDTDKE